MHTNTVGHGCTRISKAPRSGFTTEITEATEKNQILSLNSAISVVSFL